MCVMTVGVQAWQISTMHWPLHSRVVNSAGAHPEAGSLRDAVQRLDRKPEGDMVLQRRQQQARVVEEHLAMQGHNITCCRATGRRHPKRSHANRAAVVRTCATAASASDTCARCGVPASIASDCSSTLHTVKL